MEHKDWYASTTIWGGIIASATPLIYSFFHFSVAPDLAGALATALGGIGGVIAIIGRMRATKQISAGTGGGK